MTSEPPSHFCLRPENMALYSVVAPSDVVDTLISEYIATFLNLKKKLTVSSECLKVINVVSA